MVPAALRIWPIALLAAFAAAFAGCTSVGESTRKQPTTSLQSLEYYPQLVKGYQNTYPSRRVLVLASIDAREFRDPTAAIHAADQGNPAIGVLLNADGAIEQRLYSAPFLTLVQKAIERSAEEAGMVAIESTDSTYSGARKKDEDYVLESRIVRCWVKKQRGPNKGQGPTWRTTAEFVIDAMLYKPPFQVAYWQGRSAAEYSDPPLDHTRGASDDETAIYDEPGQVMSIALTRAVAGIFDRDDLRTLITQDRMVRRR